jgi:hypothetical protein
MEVTFGNVANVIVVVLPLPRFLAQRFCQRLDLGPVAAPRFLNVFLIAPFPDGSV